MNRWSGSFLRVIFAFVIVFVAGVVSFSAVTRQKQKAGAKLGGFDGAGPKQIAYYYDTKINPEDTQVDMDGHIEVPKKGEILEKHGERWKVEAVMTDLSGSGALPVHKIYLVKA